MTLVLQKKKSIKPAEKGLIQISLFAIRLNTMLDFIEDFNKNESAGKNIQT